MHTSLADFPYRFYVFSEELGNNEGHEAEKILYGYPSSRSVDDQLKDVGLSEAFFRFYNTFAPQGNYRVLRTADGRMALFSPEKSIWLCLTMKFPSVRPEGGSAASSVVQTSTFITDGVLSTILSTFYQLWRLHYNNVGDMIKEQGVMDSRYHLKSFFDHLLNEAQPFTWNFLDSFSGVSFLPLERISYLKIHSFLNRLECTFNQISSTMFFYANFLTWSGLNQDDTRLLYFYASRFLNSLPDDTSDKIKSFTNGRFVQPLFGDGGPHHVALKVHLTSLPENPSVNLLAFKLSSSMVFLVVPKDDDVTEEFLHDLTDFFAEHLLSLTSDLGSKSLVSAVTSGAKEEPPFKFIYYNTSNSALKSTIHDEKTHLIEKSFASSDAVARMMALSDYLSPVEPIQVATSVSTDTWVVVKKNAQRQLFLVVNRQRGTCTLIHVAEELRKLSSSTFSDILFLEI